MPILWHRSARNDLHTIRTFYRDIDPALADRILAAVFDTARTLDAFPEIGREGRVKHTRELAIKGTRFLLAYMVKNGSPVVLVVFHTSRRWPVLWLTAAIERAKDSGLYLSVASRARPGEADGGREPDGRWGARARG